MSPYELLEVSPKARDAVIRAAYRCLVQQCHPDRNQGDAAAGARLCLINQAYALLADPLRRARYDQQAGIAGVERRGSRRTLAPLGKPSGSGTAQMRPFVFRKLV
jgi:curved DNA-binding protein CbpA